MKATNRCKYASKKTKKLKKMSFAAEPYQLSKSHLVVFSCPGPSKKCVKHNVSFHRALKKV